jgi:hypothetical protein
MWKSQHPRHPSTSACVRRRGGAAHRMRDE